MLVKSEVAFFGEFIFLRVGIVEVADWPVKVELAKSWNLASSTALENVMYKLNRYVHSTMINLVIIKLRNNF